MATRQSTIADSMASTRKYQRSRSPVAKKEVLPTVKSLEFSPAPSLGSGPVRSWVLSRERKPVVVEIRNVFSPFEPSSPIEEATRLTLTLRLPDGWDSVFDCFESCLFHEMAERSTEFFGRTVPEEELKGWYKPITKKTDEYPRNLRVKVNTQGPYRTRYWGADKQSLERPTAHTGMLFNARVVLRAVWVGEDAFGIVADCTDLQVVDEAEAVCPF